MIWKKNKRAISLNRNSLLFFYRGVTEPISNRRPEASTKI